MSNIVQLKDLRDVRTDEEEVPWLWQLRMANQVLKIREQITLLSIQRYCERRYPEPINGCIRPSTAKALFPGSFRMNHLLSVA